MVKSVQLVMGPAGSGKTTYCSTMQQHCQASSDGRRCYVGNLDPASEHLPYDPVFDLKDLVTVEDVMEELEYGPNGGLMYCMEYLLENMDWLKDNLDSMDDDDYLIIDCPGQIELYTHVPLMRRVSDQLRSWGYNVVAVFIIDATFVCDAPKFISGSLLSLSAMVQMELPHINVLSKCDMVDPQDLDTILDVQSASAISLDSSKNEKLNRLTRSISGLIDDFSQVSFLPLNIDDEDSITLVLAHADHCIGYGEDVDVKIRDDEEIEDGED